MSDKVKKVIRCIEEGEVATSIIKNPLFKSFSLKDSQYLLDHLSQLYHFNTPLVSDEYYDILESIHGEKFGKNKKIGARPVYEEENKVFSDRKDRKDGDENENKGELVSRSTGHKPKIVDLPTPMWGLSKLKDDKGLSIYTRKFSKSDFILTDKLDGNAANFVYKIDNRGKMSLGLYKRGDEQKGTDITYLLPYIKNIPYLIPSYTGLSVKGELVIDRETFSKRYKQASCARNTVSGLTNSKEFYKEEACDIKFVAYYIYYVIDNNGEKLDSLCQGEQLEFLKNIGFEIPYYSKVSINCINSENLSLVLSKRKEESKYDIDGICICADIPIEIPLDKDPEHIVAFKMLGDTQLTRVTNIVWSVGKRGTYDPIVHFETVLLDGAKLNKASGYNARFIVKNGIGKGAKIIVTRSGGVIPKIIETISPVEPELPVEGTFEWIESSKEGEEPIFIRPLNNIGDEQMEIRKIVAFFKERESEFLALKTISKLYFGGYNTLKSLFNIKVEDICKIDGFKKKSAERIYFNINKAIIDAPLHEVMAGSSLFPGFGKKRLKQIVIGLGEEYILSLCHIPVEDRKDENRKLRDRLKRLGGFNKLTSIFVDNIYPFLEWLDEHPEIQLSSSILPVVFEGDEEDEDGGSDEKKECKRLRGEVISFSNCRPDVHIERGIERLGGTVSVNLVKSTTILVVKNADPDKLTVKMKTALDRGVRIISMEEFKKEYGV